VASYLFIISMRFQFKKTKPDWPLIDQT